MELDKIDPQNQPAQNVSYNASVGHSISSRNSLALLIFCILILVPFFALGIYYFRDSQKKNSFNTQTQHTEISPTQPQSDEIPFSTITTFVKHSTVTTTPQNLVEGANLSDIKYSLPQGWIAEIKKNFLNQDSIFISPENEGGYLSVSVYDYPGTIGRREYYCQVSDVCIEDTTYFNEINLGNIPGYSANALDNSGGGVVFFGAKGEKFYIINTYKPPSPSEFETNYMTVLNSLQF